MPLLRLSHPTQEGTLTVSKWLKSQVLLDPQEMEELFQLPFALYNVSEVVQEPKIEKEQFLDQYRNYIESLITGNATADVRRLFSSVLSTTPDIFYAMQTSAGMIVKPTKPVVQMQLHHFFRSPVDGKFHPMVFGPESISWGIQFSYPQIFQDPKSRSFCKVVDSLDFPNTALFTQLLRFFRENTVPTTFICKGEKTAVSFRLGKKCFSWIDKHHQLKKQGIQVHVY